MAKTLQKNIRITSERWDSTETAATEPGVTANQLLAELAMEAVGRRQWLRTVHEVSLLRSSMFTAQAMVRDTIAARREHKVEEIRRNIFTAVPELPGEPAKPTLESTDSPSEPCSK